MAQTGWFGTETAKPEAKKSELMIKEVTVEAQTSAKRYAVRFGGDGTATCTCSSPRQPCYHVMKATDIHMEKCKRSRYEAVSVLHKEIRRGDVEASLYWADILSRHSEYYVSNYIRRIVGEETRNWKLFMMALLPKEHEAGYRDLVAAIASSRKKWEHHNVCALFKEQLKSYNRETYFGADHNDLIRIQLTQAIKTDDVSRLFDVWAAIEETGDVNLIERMDHILIETATQRNPTMATFSDIMKFWALYEKFTHQEVWEARVGLVEAICGGWDESMNDFNHDKGLKVDFNDAQVIRRIPTYAYDVHLRQGEKRVAEADKDGLIRPGSPQPEGLDLRWSGQIRGTAWRYAAFKQFGDKYRDVAWEDVRMSAPFWKMATDFEYWIAHSEDDKEEG